ncbi:MAG: sensor histidine kinase [Spirochaetaceae bacterium]|nr:MAG: sensor histidine kinase [Spirochaetaceae bacterium]
MYDINKNPIHTNQQAKNQLENWNQQDIEKMMKPVTLGPKTIGYFVMEETRFRNDEANRKLWQSLIRLIIASAISAFAAAAGAAVIFARGLSQPAQQVAFGLDNLAQGRPLEKIPEKGTAEISRIARSANLLGERLENEQRIRAQWAQDIAHDLRTPTASIRSQLEAMLDGIFAPDPKRIRSLLDELSRVEGLVNDLDELMRLEEPNTPIRPKIISPTILYAFLQERFDIELKAKGIDLLLEVNNNGNPSAKLLADDALLQRALSNIISNAIRHSKTNSSVVLAISLDQKTCITIRNDGVPIPELEIPRLFDRLYRGEYARNTPGSGLGLTIAQRIIKLHGGNISIISNNECGATPGSPGTSVIIEFPSA